MVSNKRIIVATVFGILSGFLCYLLGRFLFSITIDLSGFLMVLAHRSLLGFVLGISKLRMPWAIHGVLIGVIVGIPDIHFFYMVRGDIHCLLYFLFGPIWGLMIEYFTSVVFKAKSIQGA